MSEFELQNKEVISMVRRNPRRKVCADALPPIEFLDDGTVRFARKKFPWRVLIRAGCIVLGIISGARGFIHGFGYGFNGMDVLYIVGAVFYICFLGNGFYKD